MANSLKIAPTSWSRTRSAISSKAMVTLTTTDAMTSCSFNDWQPTDYHNHLRRQGFPRDLASVLTYNADFSRVGWSQVNVNVINAKNVSAGLMQANTVAGAELLVFSDSDGTTASQVASIQRFDVAIWQDDHDRQYSNVQPVLSRSRINDRGQSGLTHGDSTGDGCR